MAKFGIAGDTSGVITVQGPAIAGSNTLTWPAETGTAYLTTSTTALPGQIAWNTTVQTTGFTAVAYGGYFCNTTSAAFTVTLPATPTRGQFVVIVDYAGTSATNKITVNPNGGKINSGTASQALATNRQGITFTYIDSTQGWLVSSNVYGGSTPFVPVTYTASYLIVGGGGGGGYASGGAGGAGGYKTGTATLNGGTTYTITVGSGGSASVYPANPTNGADSSLSGSGLSTVTSTGGGAGGTLQPGAVGGNGASGGSGGGGSGDNTGLTAPGGSGTPGQGYAGGNGNTNTGPATRGGGGGGGGSGATGSNAPGNPAGNGGAGTASSITGTPATYAGGGGGGCTASGTAGTGGSGGGGNGSNTPAVVGSNGTANTGGGAGGGASSSAADGGTGGSGVVILSVPTANYSGITTGSPTVTTSGSNTILKYTSSGTYTA